MTLAQKNLVIQTILDELEISSPSIERDVPRSGPKTLVVGGRVYRVVGKHKEK